VRLGTGSYLRWALIVVRESSRVPRPPRARPAAEAPAAPADRASGLVMVSEHHGQPQKATQTFGSRTRLLRAARIQVMVTATRTRRARLRDLLLAALTALLALLGAATASAAPPSAAQTCVGASLPVVEHVVGVAQHIAAGQHRCRAPSQLQVVSGDSVDAEAEGVGSEVVEVGHAGIHQFPGVTAGKSQFFDGEELGSLSNTDGVSGVLQNNGNTRYVLRSSQGVGAGRTTGLPTNIYTVIRKPDGSVLTMFPGTSPKS